YIPTGLFYYIGVVFYGLLLIYQHRLVSPTDFNKIDRGFMTTNGIASVVFAVFYLLNIWFI
ncbi:MAG: 4-hydroxybenzoate octaprenyltransferase, partial [Sphingobacterium sp.]